MANPFSQMAATLGGQKTLREEISEALAVGPLKSRDIHDSVKQSLDLISTINELNAMVDDGLIVKAEGGIYALAESNQGQQEQASTQETKEPHRKPAKRNGDYKPTGKSAQAYDFIQAHRQIDGPALCKLLNISSEQLFCTTSRLVKNGLVFKRKIGNKTLYQMPDVEALFKTSGEASPAGEKQEAPAPQAAQKAKQSKAEIPVSETRTESVSERIAEPGVDFQIGNDGRLTITDDLEALCLEPTDAFRLVEFILDCLPVWGL